MELFVPHGFQNFFPTDAKRTFEMRIKSSLDNRINLIPWKSLPKWVYGQRISDSEMDMGWWFTDTDGINNYELKFNPISANECYDCDTDFYFIDDDGKIVVSAYSKKELLKNLSEYRKDSKKFKGEIQKWEQQ